MKDFVNTFAEIEQGINALFCVPCIKGARGGKIKKTCKAEKKGKKDDTYRKRNHATQGYEGQ